MGVKGLVVGKVEASGQRSRVDSVGCVVTKLTSLAFGGAGLASSLALLSMITAW